MKRSLLSLALLGVLAAGCHTSIAFDGGTPIAIQGEAPKAKPKLTQSAAKAILKGKKIEISEMVQFELNSSVIRSESFGLLDDVAKVIKDH
ncbi:MAG: hypothetical protein HOV80_24095, partial [Polyangiaceae bacterium]|nr:hypothetical protein [Polyangiaceae bacterium]